MTFLSPILRLLFGGIAVGMFIDYLSIGLFAGRWDLAFFFVGMGSLFICILGRCHRRVQVDHQLIGVRGFRFGENGSLGALTQRGTWKKGINEAQCIAEVRVDALGGELIRYRSGHLAPDAGCKCGFNVHHSLTDLHTSGYQYHCAAVIEGWGVARLHPDGWRSQYARIVALIDEEAGCYEEIFDYPGSWISSTRRIIHQRVRDEHRIKLEAASMRYEVPIITAQQAARGLEEFGTSIPKEKCPRRR